MPIKIRFENEDYNLEELNPAAKKLYQKIQYIQFRVAELKDREALTNKAKNGYIEDLKKEILNGKTGLDLGNLFADD